MERRRSRKRMLMWVILVLLLPAPLLGTPTNAVGASSPIYACVNPSGLTRIVGAPQDCRPNESPKSWPTEGTSTVQGGTLTVIDSANKTVGPLIDPNTVLTVGLTVNGDRFLVGVRPQGFFSLIGVTFYYADASCSGTPLVPPSTGVFFPYLRVIGPTGYYASMASVAQEVQVATSKTYNNGVPQSCTDASWLGKLMLVPATTVNLNPVFTPPFSVTVK